MNDLSQLTGRKLALIGVWAQGHRVQLGLEGRVYEVKTVRHNTIFTRMWHDTPEGDINRPDDKITYSPVTKTLTIERDEYLAIYTVH